jgi:sec-independent protein translocase protein TatC
MPLLAHLIELRRRLLAAAVSVVIACVAGWFVAAPVIDALRAPLAEFAAQHHRLAALNYDTIAGAFDLRFRIALHLAIVLSSPVWLYQIWAFLLPALTRKELRVALAFFGSAVPLFLAGCLTGWLVVPHMVLLLAGFAPAGSATLVTASAYFDFILKLVLALGIAFVLPVFLVLLNLVGVLRGSTILRSWRIAVLAVVGFTALVTPSADVLSMCLLALPLLGLYFGAAGVAVLHDRRVDRLAATAVLGGSEPLLPLDG